MKIEMGKKYQTRAGTAVRILAVDSAGSQPVVGIINGRDTPDTWRSDGGYYHTIYHQSNADLVEVPEPKPSTTIYAAAAKISAMGTANYVASRQKDEIERHGRRIGPVVEVALPHDPPKPKVTAARIRIHCDKHGRAFLAITLSNGNVHGVQTMAVVDEAVTLVPEGALRWVSGDTKPEVGRKVLGKCEMHFRLRGLVRMTRAIEWDGFKWRPEDAGSFFNGVVVSKWAYFNEEG